MPIKQALNSAKLKFVFLYSDNFTKFVSQLYIKIMLAHLHCCICQFCFFLPFLADTYVMKLFDRSVDLAQFNENTPLYPICRAWIKNQPHNHSNQERSPSPDSDIDVKDKVVIYAYCRYGSLVFHVSVGPKITYT